MGAKLSKDLNHLSELKALQEAYENRWILSTSQLSCLLNIDANAILTYSRFEQHGFIFHRCGKVLSEAGWVIRKSSYEHDDDY